MKHLTILDYSVGQVFIYETPKLKTTEKAEEWIIKNTSHKLSQISFMTTKEEVEIIYPDVL